MSLTSLSSIANDKSYEQTLLEDIHMMYKNQDQLVSTELNNYLKKNYLEIQKIIDINNTYIVKKINILIIYIR